MRAHAVLLAILALATLTPVSVQALDSYWSSINVDQQVVLPGQDVHLTFSSERGFELLVFRLEEPVGSWTEANGTLVQSMDAPARSRSGLPSGLVLRGLEEGIYRLELRHGDRLISHAPLQVTGLGLVARVAGADRLVWAVDLHTGAGVPGVELELADGSRATTGPDGLARTASGPALFARSALGAAFLEGSYAGHQEAKVLVYTDRPLYRPGQTVHAKVVAQAADAPGSGVATLTVTTWETGREQRVTSQSLPLNGYGTASTSFTLPAGASLGHYAIQVQWGGMHAYGGFEVQEYRVPSFEVRVSHPDSAVAGEAVEALVHAKRFAGGSLDKGTVRHEWSMQPSWTPWYDCAWCGIGMRAPAEGMPSVSGETELRPDGTALLRLKTAGAGTYWLRVSVTAPTGERIEALERVEVSDASLRLAIGMDRHGVEAGEPATATVTATDLAGQPTSASVQVLLLRDGKQVWSGAVEAVGSAPVTFVPPAAGSYELRATATDTEGRATSASRWLWAWDRDPLPADRLEVRAVRPTLAPGQPASLHVAGASGPVLLTLEAEGILAHRMLQPGESAADLPTAGAESARLSAVATQLRLRKGFMPEPEEARDQVTLAPHPKGLQVTVAHDRSAYANGDTARILVQVRDHLGRPVRAEVGIAMVDEALLSLRDGGATDLLARLHPESYGGHLQSSLSRRGGWSGWGGGGGVFLEAADGAQVQAARTGTSAPTGALLDLDASSRARAEAPAVQVRKEFPETGLWLPHAATGADGILRLQVALPDSLTRWRFEAVALSLAGQAGTGSATLQTGRDVEAELFMPRFLVDGDRSTLHATVWNQLPETHDFQVRLDLAGLVAEGAATRTVTVAPGGSGLVAFPVLAQAEGLANATFTAWARGTSSGDAVQRSIPVHPHGTPSLETRSGRGAADLQVEVPADATEGRGTLEVVLSPTIAQSLVEALPFLTGFPYGCVEQTLSRFLPNVAVARAAAAFGIPVSAIDPQLDEQVAAGLDALYGYQHGTGAWGWWHDDEDNPYTTAYVVYGLAQARAAGYAVDESVLARGVDALLGMAASSKGALHAYQVYALSVADPARAPAVRDATEPAELAMMILAAHAQGDSAWGRERLGRLLASGVRSGDSLHWADPKEAWTSHGMSSDTMATALALRAIAAVDPDHPDALAAVRWLLSNRAGANWDTTKDSAEAILSLVEVLGTEADREGARGVTVLIDGQERRVTFDAGAWAAPPRISLTAAAGAHRVQVEPDAGQTVYWSVVVRSHRSGEPIPASPGPFAIARRILDDEGRPVTRMQVGEEATVTVTVRSLDGARYLQVTDPLPAGTEAVQEEEGMPYPYMLRASRVACGSCSWANVEFRDDRAEAFLTHLPAGQAAEFRYRVRAVFPGDYHVLPTQVVGMYDPDLAGHGPESRLAIESPPVLEVGRFAVEPAPAEGAPRELVANLHPEDPQAPVEVEVRGPDGTLLPTPAPVLELDGAIVRVRVQLPEGAATVEVQSGEVAATIPVTVPEPPALPPAPFGAPEEAIWSAGAALAVASPLHPRQGGNDFAARFAGVAADPLSGGGRIASAVPGPGALLALAALALAGAGWRRLRPA